MRVLILGATGRLGRQVAAHLRAKGHAIVGVSRRRREAFRCHPEYGWIAGDLHRDLEPGAWQRKLYAFDAVVNCAGLRRESRDASFETVHALGPAALYEACRQAGVRRVVHVTLEGDAAARRCHALATRRYAERKLESLPLDWAILACAEDVPQSRICEAVAAAVESTEPLRCRRSLADPRLLLLYDGDCPICVFEMRRLRALDRRGRLDRVNVAAPGFEPARYGTTLDALMGRMHAVAPDGRLLIGMDAIRAAYGAVGLGWLLAPTRLPGVRAIADRAYLAFARHRYGISRWLGMRCTDRCAAGPG